MPRLYLAAAPARPVRKFAFPVLLCVMFLGVFSAIFFWDGPPQSEAAPTATVASAETDSVTARFGLCGAGPRSTCVVDGDTIWLYGTKIRIADINTPEIANPRCQEEAEAGRTAMLRLAHLLNEAPFRVLAADRDEDRFGRKLRIVVRHGRSLGQMLVAEGLAEEWNGARIDWC